MIRLLDISFSLCGIILASPLLLLLVLLGFIDTGSPIFMQTRVGREKLPFTLYKLRTMSKDTQSVASHLVGDAQITAYGKFLRRTKLDELPQLWNVLKGDMSLVGPRPGLFNQIELTKVRDEKGVFKVRPGITGLAQVQGIDMSTPEQLAETDSEMIAKLTIRIYFHLIIATVFGHGQGDAAAK